jgi:hypothetical protein
MDVVGRHPQRYFTSRHEPAGLARRTLSFA